MCVGAAVPARDALPSGGDTTALFRLIHDPSFDEILSHSFATILSDSQRAEYTACPGLEKSVYRTRFWNRCDPTPATELNEFLEEHLRRLCYTLENFCPGGDTEWDDRGDVAIRFGIPAHRAVEMGDISMAYGGMGLIPSSEHWSYPDMDMVLHFIDPNMDGRYQTGFDTKLFTARGRAPTPVDSRDPSVPYTPPPSPVNVEAHHAASRAKSQQDRGMNALSDVSVTYGYRPTKEPLPFFYEIVTARGDEGASDVAINYQVPHNALSFAPAGDRRKAVLTKELRVMTSDYDEILHELRALRVVRHAESELAEGDLLTDEWRVDAEPGTYVIGFCVEDSVSGRRGYGRSLVRLPAYTGGFRMSDIQLARTVGPGRRFARMGGAVVPHPIHAFRRDEQMIVYFELYGLTEDFERAGRFTVTTEITGHDRPKDEGWLSRFVRRALPRDRVSVSSRVIGSGPVPDTAFWFALSLANLPEDNYDLVLTVKDVRSGLEARSMAAFTVLED
jgi:GWxTD domain-containing protein